MHLHRLDMIEVVSHVESDLLQLPQRPQTLARVQLQQPHQQAAGCRRQTDSTLWESSWRWLPAAGCVAVNIWNYLGKVSTEGFFLSTYLTYWPIVTKPRTNKGLYLLTYTVKLFCC